MWFLMVENLCPLKYEAPKASEEAPNLRTRSYNSAPILIEEKKRLQTRSYSLSIKSSK